jgi:pilus assembly protein Flp/PilA
MLEQKFRDQQPAIRRKFRAKRPNGQVVATLVFRTRQTEPETVRQAAQRQGREAQMIKRFIQEEEGQTLVEYGLLVSLIALVVIAVLTLLGRKVQTVFNVAQNALTTS